MINDLDKRIEQLELELFYFKLIKCLTKTLFKETKSTNNSEHNDFIMKRFMKCE